MNKERLEKVIELLKKPLPKGIEFSMNQWKEKNMCGTTVCACGLVASHPWFKKRGFHLKLESEIEGCNIYQLFYKNYSIFDAVEKFFDINEGDAFYLFDPIAYKRSNRRDVYQRIEKYIRNNKVKSKTN